MSRETVAPFSPIVPSLLQVTLTRNRATHKQPPVAPVGLQAIQATAAMALLSTRQVALSSQVILLARNTSSQLPKVVWVWCPAPCPPPDFAFLFYAYHNPVRSKVAPSGYKIIIAACIKKNWVSGAANNQKHPLRPQSSSKNASCKVPGCPHLQRARGMPAPLGSGTWLAGLQCHHGKLAQVATNK